jgi:VWFA-related protein
MRSRLILRFLLAGFLGPPLLAGDSPPKAHKPPVVSVSLELVQVDAVVTDGKGRYVEDLGCEDFEIYQDRRKQTITNCSFVRTPDSAVPKADEAQRRPATGTRPIGREDVRRTIALVVDDLHLDFQSVVSVRRALEAFVQSQTAPGDLVSIIRTSAGVGTLQQFTTDRRVLRAAIERIRVDFWANVDLIEPQGAIPLLDQATAGGGSLPLGPSGRRKQGKIAELRADIKASGTLSALSFVLMGLRDLPGRKSLVLFSNGHRMWTSQQFSTAYARGVPSLVELANRASVVIYTVDTAGVMTGQLTAADNLNPPGAAAVSAVFSSDRSGSERFLNGLDGLDALSDPTGGLLLRGSNDLSLQLGKVLEDQKGYYLIGYVPDASSFSAGGKPAFHRIQVKVRRKGLRVRSRKGFFGMTDEDPRVARPSQGTPLAASLLSPFGASEVGLRLNSVFHQDNAQRALLHSFLHVDAEDMTLAANPDGTFRTQAEILAYTFDADGQVVDRLSRAGELRLTPEGRDVALRHGINYTLDVPVKKAGGYQLRVALRDTASGRLGSAYQFVEVPDLANERLALSGILMTNAVSEGAGAVPAPEDSLLPGDGAGVFATAACRAFAPGQPIAYGVTVYNARVDAASGQAALQTQVKVFLDGKEVIAGSPRAVATEGQENRKALFAGGILLLPRHMIPGEYQLLVTVVDAQAPLDRRMAVQTTLFEVEALQAANGN